ncbi:MAG TPA: hypothetical protein VMU78_06570 [Methylocella sp.]|nr:hypothetical protein [Methylocella sp.]
MADYHTPTVVQQTIPNDDMTPLERLLLTNIFDADDINGEHYFYAEESPQTMLTLDKAELNAAIAGSQEHPNSVLPTIQEQLSHCEPHQSTIYLDLSGFSWEAIFQDIVRRSNTLDYISVISSFTCSKMHSDAFGGMAVLITATNIRGKSTEDILEELLEEEEAGPFAPISSATGATANV